MSTRNRTPDAPCRKYWAKESAYNRRKTARMLRRSVRLWLKRACLDALPCPDPRRTQGRLTH